MFRAWQPLTAIYAFPPGLSRKQRGQWRQLATGSKRGSADPATYSEILVNRKHGYFGGVTQSHWEFAHHTRMRANFTRASIMTARDFDRPLQTALDDTVKGAKGVAFEELSPGEDAQDGRVGYARRHRSTERRPVYDGSGKAPDLGRLRPGSDRRIWVIARSVFAEDTFAGRRGCLRQLTDAEVLSVWDYEGKEQPKGWPAPLLQDVISSRLLSPPAKMVRAFTYAAGDTLLQQLHLDGAGGGGSAAHPLRQGGRTSDVPFSPLEDAAEARLKAAQTDDTEVNLAHWAPPGETNAEARARDVLRRLALRWWKWHQVRQATTWLEANPGRSNAAAVSNCVDRIRGATYWSWPRGSRIFFWKFLDWGDWFVDFRDGVRYWRLEAPPKGHLPNLPAPSREAELLARLKVFQLRMQGFIYRDERRPPSLVIPRFLVPKVVAEDGTVLDVRCVWDCRSNGHNATLFAPGFMLPTALDAEDQVIKWLSLPVAEYLQLGSPAQDYTQDTDVFAKTKQGDVDIGKHFNNFGVHEVDQDSMGVRYIYTSNKPGAVEREELWKFSSCCFGNSNSPYVCCQAQARLLEAATHGPGLGVGGSASHIPEFHSTRCVLNLPTATNYDPSLPRVLLLREDGEVAARQVTQVDDIRVAARAKVGEFDHAAAACKQLKSRLNSFGNQADDRKWRPPQLRPGAWNGIIIHTDTPFPMKSTTVKKWLRFKQGLRLVLDAVEAGNRYIETSALRSVAGLGVNVTEVYPLGRCYLKGFFNAVEAWRDGRDLEGWRLSQEMDVAGGMDAREAHVMEFEKGYPVTTRITQELIQHCQALERLFAGDTPLMTPLRPTDAPKLRYVVGDASAEGFFIATQYPDGHLTMRGGLWQESFADGGSNLREAQNFGNHLLEEISSGRHDGCALWGFTDNAVWSHVWSKGMSTVRHLFSLALDIKVAAQEHEVWAHMCHISGGRMILTGIDGGSRGNADAGVLVGHDIRGFIPLDLSAFDLAGDCLSKWCADWMGSDYAGPLEPLEWFTRGHQPGVHVWAPPPAAALVALKEVAHSRQKRPRQVAHVFLCQRLLWQEEWRRRLEKEMDVWFNLHPGKYWACDLHEPLIVGLCFPMRGGDRGPWLVRQERDKVVQIGRTLSEVSKTCHLQVRDYLRQFWARPWTFPTLPRGLVC